MLLVTPEALGGSAVAPWGLLLCLGGGIGSRPMDVATAQGQLGEAIQSSSPGPGWYCAGWVIVAEWVPPEGERVLSRIQSPDLTSWARTGYLNEALAEDEWDGRDPDEEFGD